MAQRDGRLSKAIEEKWTVQEAAATLGVGQWVIYGAIKRGDLKCIRYGAGKRSAILIRVSDLLNWQESCESGGEPHDDQTEAMLTAKRHGIELEEALKQRDEAVRTLRNLYEALKKTDSWRSRILAQDDAIISSKATARYFLRNYR